MYEDSQTDTPVSPQVKLLLDHLNKTIKREETSASDFEISEDRLAVRHEEKSTDTVDYVIDEINDTVHRDRKKKKELKEDGTHVGVREDRDVSLESDDRKGSPRRIRKLKRLDDESNN